MKAGLNLQTPYAGFIKYPITKVGVNNQIITFPENAFKIESEIGKGNFGKVFKGKILKINHQDHENTVAIKSIRGLVGQSEIDAFFKEIKIMSRIEPHVNLVGMLGTCTSNLQEEGKCWLILEYCQHGDLKKFLIMNKANILSGVECDAITSRCLLQWAYDVANGMKYLAERNIMHGDLAARNILMGNNPLQDNSLVAKVADFGLSKTFYDNITYEKESRLKVPWKWMALEYLTRDLFTLNSDVWSFGVLFWEILSFGRNPYGPQEFHEVLEKLKKGYRLPHPEEAEEIGSWNTEKVYSSISKLCFEADPLKRASFSKILNKLEGELSTDEMTHFRKTDESYHLLRPDGLEAF